MPVRALKNRSAAFIISFSIYSPSSSAAMVMHPWRMPNLTAALFISSFYYGYVISGHTVPSSMSRECNYIFLSLLLHALYYYFTLFSAEMTSTSWKTLICVWHFSYLVLWTTKVADPGGSWERIFLGRLTSLHDRRLSSAALTSTYWEYNISTTMSICLIWKWCQASACANWWSSFIASVDFIRLFYLLVSFFPCWLFDIELGEIKNVLNRVFDVHKSSSL